MCARKKERRGDVQGDGHATAPSPLLLGSWPHTSMCLVGFSSRQVRDLELLLTVWGSSAVGTTLPAGHPEREAGEVHAAPKTQGKQRPCGSCAPCAQPPGGALEGCRLPPSAQLPGCEVGSLRLDSLSTRSAVQTKPEPAGSTGFPHSPGLALACSTKWQGSWGGGASAEGSEGW